MLSDLRKVLADLLRDIADRLDPVLPPPDDDHV